MTKQTLLLAALAAAPLGAGAQAPGAFDFSQVPGLSTSPTVEIDLNSAMLGFVAAAIRETDPQASELLAGINGVRVVVYERIDDTQAVLDFVQDASSALEAEGWQRAVVIDDGADKVRIYMSSEDTQLTGLTIMVAEDGGDAVFVNVDGTIDPAQLGRIAATLGMEGMIDTFTGLGGDIAGAGGPSDTPRGGGAGQTDAAQGDAEQDDARRDGAPPEDGAPAED